MHVRVVREHQRQFLLEHQHAGRHQRSEVPAGVHQLRQHRNIRFLGGAHRLKIAQFQLRHAAAALFLSQGDRDAVVREHGGEIFAGAGFVAVHVAGGEQRHLAFRRAGRFARRIERQLLQAAAQRPAGELRQPGLGMDAGHGLQHLARGTNFVDRIHRLGDDGNAGEFADRVGAGQHLVAQLGGAFLEVHRLGAQHEMGEIHVPLVRWHVRTLGHVAEVAQVAVIHHLPVVLLLDAVHFQGR